MKDSALGGTAYLCRFGDGLGLELVGSCIKEIYKEPPTPSGKTLSSEAGKF